MVELRCDLMLFLLHFSYLQLEPSVKHLIYSMYHRVLYYFDLFNILYFKWLSRSMVSVQVSCLQVLEEEMGWQRASCSICEHWKGQCLIEHFEALENVEGNKIPLFFSSGKCCDVNRKCHHISNLWQSWWLQIVLYIHTVVKIVWYFFLLHWTW